MAHATTPCIFCARSGAGVKLTREHGIPEWLTKLVGPPSPTTRFTIIDSTLNSYTGAAQNKVKADVSSPSQVPIRGPCYDCNTTWMSNIESRAQPIIEAVFNGGRPRVTAGMQRDLAAWATKVVLMSDLYTPQHASCSAADYRWLCKHHTPPPNWHVWTAAYTGTPSIRVEHRGLPISFGSAPPAVTNTANVSTILAGRLILHVFGSQIDFRSPDMPASMMPHIRQIWQAGSAFDWPPGAALDGRGFFALHRALTRLMVGPGRHV